MRTWPMYKRNLKTFQNVTRGRISNRRGLCRQKPSTPVPVISVTDTSAHKMESDYEQGVLKIIAIGNPNYFNKSEKWNSLICDLLSRAYVISPTERTLRNERSIENVMLNSHAAVFIMTDYSVNDVFSLHLLQQAKASKLMVVSVRDPSFDLSFNKHFERPKSGRFGARRKLITNNIQSTSMEKIRGKQNGLTLNRNGSLPRDLTSLQCMINVLRFEFENAIVYCKSTSLTSNLILKRVYEIQNGAKKHKLECDPLLQADDSALMDNAKYLKVPSVGSDSSLFLSSDTSFDNSSESEIDIPQTSSSTQLEKIDPAGLRRDSISSLSTEDMCKMEEGEEEEDETCFWVFPDKAKGGGDVAPKLIRWPHTVENTPFDAEWKSESSTGFQDIDLSILLSSSSSLTEKYSDEEDVFN